MKEPIEGGDLDLSAGLTGVQVVDHRVGGSEPDELDPVFGGDVGNPGGEGAFVLAETALVARSVHQPGDACLRVGVLDLLEARYGRADEVAPPTVMRWVFEFLPLVKRDPAADDDVLLLVGGGRRGGASQEQGEGEETFHARFTEF